MATRNYFLRITAIIFALVIVAGSLQRVIADDNRLTPPEDLSPTSADSSGTNVEFTIASADPDNFSGTIQFVVKLEQSSQVPVNVFIYSGDHLLVRTVNLQSSANARQWQANFDTNQLPTGYYQFKAGFRTFTTAEPTIWSEGYWAHVSSASNSSSTATPAAPEKIFSLPSNDTSSSTASSTAEIATTTTPLNGTIEAIEVTDFCARQGITTKDECDQVERFRLPPACRGQQSETLAECDSYLRQYYEVPLCTRENVVDSPACMNYLIKQAEKEKFCGQWPELACATVLGSWYRGPAAAQLTIAPALELAVRPLYQQTLDWQSIVAQINHDQLITSALPFNFTDQNPLVRLIPVQSGATIDTNQDWQAVWPLALQFDQDNDGLSDDTESRYGTKSDQVDSDNDGYLDGEELGHGFNPAGSGKVPGVIAGIDQALLAGKALQQPWTFGTESDKLQITEVSTFISGQGLHLRGTGPASQVITLFIGEPLPYLATITTDEKGIWEFSLNHQLRDGEFQMYATMIDAQGTIIAKSKPTTIYWRQNQLVSLQQLTQEQPLVKGVAYDRFGVTTPLALGLVFAGLLIGATLIVVSWRRW